MITRDEARKRIAGNVLLLMDEKGLNRSDLSERSGVAHPRITLLVRGELLPNPADLWNVAEALGTTLDGLMKPLPQMVNA